MGEEATTTTSTIPGDSLGITEPVLEPESLTMQQEAGTTIISFSTSTADFFESQFAYIVGIQYLIGIIIFVDLLFRFFYYGKTRVNR